MAEEGRWFWQQPDWLSTPILSDETYAFANQLAESERKLLGDMGVELYKATIVQSIADNLHCSYAIEGEKLDENLLRSSIMKRLNMDIPDWKPSGMSRTDREDKAVQAALFLLNDKEALSPEKLEEAHAMLKTEERGTWGKFRSTSECIRDAQQNVVYEAPPAEDVPELMGQFCRWWNDERVTLPASIGAALGHAFFVVIHPFEDGNGRMARLLADKAMALGMGEPYRPYSMSSVIYQGLSQYYRALDQLPEENGIQRFVTLMAHMQSDVLDKAMIRMESVKNMEAVISIAEASGTPITPLGRAMLKTMALEPERKIWTPFDASRDVRDAGDEDPWDVWNDLVKRGIIQGKNIVSPAHLSSSPNGAKRRPRSPHR
ncbi:MAG: Fic family protein [Fretibacterium sp.]|nr:Fic family protein [Fretibacterium sp.]